jgi:hypothetical protein
LKAGFGTAYKQIGTLAGGDDQDYYSLVVLSKELATIRSWFGKLDILLRSIAEAEGDDPKPLALLDGVVSDIVGTATVIQDLLGVRPNLAAALCALIDLSGGRLDVESRTEDDPAILLNRLFAENRLPASRKVMVDWVKRQLKGSVPLARNMPDGERTAFKQVIGRLCLPDGVIGGPSMAEAIALRMTRFFEEGGNVGRRYAIAGLPGLFTEPGDAIRYLLTLAVSPLGKQFPEDVEQALEGLVPKTSQHRFFDTSAPIKENLERMGALYTFVVGAEAPEPLKQMVAAGLDELTVGYIQEIRLIERLDNPKDILRHRAVRLLQVCTPGTLVSPKALTLVRKRVIDHLRQPNFDAKYVEDITDDETRKRTLRDFYGLLNKAGFS